MNILKTLSKIIANILMLLPLGSTGWCASERDDFSADVTAEHFIIASAEASSAGFYIVSVELLRGAPPPISYSVYGYFGGGVGGGTAPVN